MFTNKLNLLKLTVDANNIGAPKMRNNYGTINFALFTIVPPPNYLFSNFAISKAVALNLVAKCFCDRNSLRYYLIFDTKS